MNWKWTLTHSKTRLFLDGMGRRRTSWKVDSLKVDMRCLHTSTLPPHFLIPFSTFFLHFSWLIHPQTLLELTTASRTRLSTSFATRRLLSRLEYRKFVLFFSRQVLITIETNKDKTEPRKLEKENRAGKRGKRSRKNKKTRVDFSTERRTKKQKKRFYVCSEQERERERLDHPAKK